VPSLVAPASIKAWASLNDLIPPAALTPIFLVTISLISLTSSSSAPLLPNPVSVFIKSAPETSTILQIPMSKSLKRLAQEIAGEQGFSSLQDLVRVVLTKLARRELVVSVSEPAVVLSKKNSNRYLKMSLDLARGANSKKFSSMQGLMHDLRT